MILDFALAVPSLQAWQQAQDPDLETKFRRNLVTYSGLRNSGRGMTCLPRNAALAKKMRDLAKRIW